MPTHLVWPQWTQQAAELLQIGIEVGDQDLPASRPGAVSDLVTVWSLGSHYQANETICLTKL